MTLMQKLKRLAKSAGLDTGTRDFGYLNFLFFREPI